MARWCKLFARWVIKLSSLFHIRELVSRTTRQQTQSKTQRLNTVPTRRSAGFLISFVDFVVSSVKLEWIDLRCVDARTLSSPGDEQRFVDVTQDFKRSLGLVMSISCRCGYSFCLKVVCVFARCSAFVSAAWEACSNEHKNLHDPTHCLISQTCSSQILVEHKPNYWLTFWSYSSCPKSCMLSSIQSNLFPACGWWPCWRANDGLGAFW